MKPINSTKIDDFTLEIAAEPVKTQYDRKTIEELIISVQINKDGVVAHYDARLAELQAILKEMDDVGIVVKPSLPIDQPII